MKIKMKTLKMKYVQYLSKLPLHRDPGWDKVGQLAEELVGLTGIAVSAAQAEKIKALCNALDDYDKRAIEVHLRSQQPSLRGHFCSRKGTGHTTIEQMRR